MSHADDVRAALPEGMTLPEPFARTFDWIEAQGWTDTIPDRPADDLTARNLYVYPEEERSSPAASIVVFGFEAGPPMHAPPPEAIARVMTLATIAGDGGTLSLWLDDDGKQWIVVVDHGWPCVLTDDPLVALQFLAIGYGELAAITDPTRTAEEDALHRGADPTWDFPPILPHAFRDFFAQAFSVPIPERASELGSVVPDEDAMDPVRSWMANIEPDDPAFNARTEAQMRDLEAVVEILERPSLGERIRNLLGLNRNWGGRHGETSMTYANDVRAHLPEGMHLPDAFAQTFDWLEAQGWSGIFTHADQEAFSSRYLSIYPPDERDEYAASIVLFRFEAGPPLHQTPEDVVARITTIAKIAGDGGTLSLWLDDGGTQRFVVFNHGIPFVLTDDPLVALQFLALGYMEPGALEDPTQTPLENANGDDILPPHAFRTFLSDTFGVTLPERASDLGIVIPPEGAPDPIRDWMAVNAPVPGETPEHPYIVTREMRDRMAPGAVAYLRKTIKYVIEEE